jgi:hypothetical protein
MKDTLDLKDFRIGDVYYCSRKHPDNKLFIGLLLEIHGESLHFRTIYDSFNFLELSTGLVPLYYEDLKEFKTYSEKEKLALILKYS